ncbi:MAG: DUF6167 family protein [Nocardioidaceae bacterium]|nr:DUF6167 family protein [Nocardioidaceae bacterium]MCL2612243.1 DUF6167 family protein [Nocardioidaceae bacterium]
MRRGFWFGAGVAAGVYGMVRARRVAEAFTPDGMRDRVKAAGLGARMLRDEMAQGTADAETGLRERYGLPSPGEGHPQLPAPQHDRRALPSDRDQHDKDDR